MALSHGRNTRCYLHGDVKVPPQSSHDKEKPRGERCSRKAVNLEPFMSTECFLYEAAIKHFLEEEKQE